MCQLVESIRVENRQLHQIEWHNQRLNRSGKSLFNWDNWVDLSEKVTIPDWLTTNRYKCRVVTDGVSFDVSFELYEQRKIQTIKIIHSDVINYPHKTTNREMLNEAYQHRGDCDDVIIVKNGFITDSSAANILLFDGKIWITPDTPLLRGTQREYLLAIGKIDEKSVPLSELGNYSQLKLINALIPYEYADIVSVPEGLFF
jgi:4-amino-4-deoxychorismate lyase